MAKIHLLVSTEPIENGQAREAVCGEVIPNAQAVPLADFQEQQRSTIMFCSKCFSRNYMYAIATGQDSKDLEAEVA